MIPADITGLDDYERHAQQRLPEATWRHIQEGSGRGLSLAANRADLDRIALLPRALADIRHGSTAIDLLGHRHATPILLGPVAYQRLAHEEGELAAARAACALGMTMVLSTLSSVPLEDVARAAEDAARQLARPLPPLWFQLYFQPTRNATAALVRRAEAANYEAIVVTVDAAMKRSGFALPPGVEAANLVAAPPQPQQAAIGGPILFGTPLVETAIRWDDIAWLRDQTRLPVLIKGILAPDDARKALEYGMEAIIVSNHGGRILDGAPSAVAALPAIADLVHGAVPILFDGGVRSGVDVAKALALGADAVLIGRPQFHALAVAGMTGMAHMLHLLRAEFELAMAQLGCATPAEIGADQLFGRHPRL